MTSLLQNRFAPLTFRMGFLEAGLDVCSRHLVAWRREHIPPGAVIREVREFGSLESALISLNPLSTLRRRELLLETRSTWTAYFDNGMRGADPVPVMSYLATRIDCRAVAIENTPQTLAGRGAAVRGSFGAVQFELFGPTPTEFLNSIRAVSVANDGGRWRFTVTGSPQPFEDLESYRHKAVRDRFTSALLVRYCQAIGVSPFDPEFYGTRGTLLVDTRPLPVGHQEAELEDVRKAVLALANLET